MNINPSNAVRGIESKRAGHRACFKSIFLFLKENKREEITFATKEVKRVKLMLSIGPSSRILT